MVARDCCRISNYSSFRHVLRNLPLKLALDLFRIAPRLGQSGARRSVIRVNSEGFHSLKASPGQSAVPLLTYSAIPSTS